MTIYVRNEEGKLTSLEVLTLKGEKGQDGANGKDGITPNVQIGKVTTLDPGEQATVTRRGTNEEPIFDFSIPRGADGTGEGGVSIDDGTISTNKTWSSAKIEDFVLNNDNAVWTDVNGENLKIDSTKEGYLREVEILGNTIQGFADCVTNKQIVDSILSTGLDNKTTLNEDNTFTVYMANFSSTTDWSTINKEGFIQLEPNTKYSVGCWRENGTFPLCRYTLYEETGITMSTGMANHTFTTGKSGKVLLHPVSAQGGKLKIRVVKGDYKLTDYPYDYNLSSIQHLGELYVDDDGKPKLDSQGRKQYKVEVESREALPLSYFQAPRNATINGTHVKLVCDSKTKYFSDVLYGLNPNDVEIGDIVTLEITILNKTNLKDNIAFYLNNQNNFGNNVGINTTILNKKQIYTTEITKLPNAKSRFLMFGMNHGDSIDTSLEGSIEFYYKIYSNKTKSHKTTILIPCQLMKVDDVSDRLYWDSSKGRYVIEIKNKKLAYLDYQRHWMNYFIDDTEVCIALNEGYINDFIEEKDKVLFNNKKIISCEVSPKSNTSSHVYLYLTKEMLTRKGYEFSYEGARKYLIDENVTLYLPLLNSQLVDTNITEELKLPTYINNTYISVSGGIQGSIKAKAPIDGGKVIKNLQRENMEIKATNEVQDELINVIMLATDEMFMILEPLLPEAIDLNERSTSNMADMYIAMVQRGIKTIDEVPARYREQVKQTLDQLEK